jgi:hypothetical protein
VHQAAHVLANTEQSDLDTLRQAYQQVLGTVTRQQDLRGELAPVVAHFQKGPASSWDGLFECSQVNDVPRTTNDLEQYVGTARHGERRVTGRTRASPTLVVRGSVRVGAVGASRLGSFSASDLRLTTVTAWKALRQTLHFRHEARRNQLRFRRDPQAYLTLLEQRLLR